MLNNTPDILTLKEVCATLKIGKLFRRTNFNSICEKFESRT